MAETQTPAADRLRVMRAAQGILSEADARRSGGDGGADARDDAHLDSFASASAGLMQLSSAAAAVPDSNHGGSNSSSPGADEIRRGAERPLPPGWNRIIHGSGLPCYANFRLGIVCWSKPYALGADATQLAEPDFTRYVKKHVPPVGIFSPMGGAPPERASAASTAASAVNSVSSSKLAASSPLQAAQIKASGASVGRPGAAITGLASSSAAHPAQTTEEPANAKKRKVEAADRAVHHSSRSSDKFSTMTLDEFKRLAIDDPRVLQACMELSVKTPAQVLQEYQNRNRGVSINYNTVPSDVDGVKLFKTIVTAGNTVAEGTASTKKIAKQLGAQQLLALLHERTARTYMQVAELYSSSIKGQPVIAEALASAAPASAPAPTPAPQSLSGQTISNSLRSVGTLGRIVDTRFARANSGGSSSSSSIHGLGAAPGGSGHPSADSGSRLRKFRRASPTREYDQYGRPYSDAAEYNASNQWEGYHQEDGGPTWARDGGHVDSPGPERIVVYSSPSSTNNNYGSPYYSGGHAPWTFAPPGGLPLPPPPQQPSSSVTSPSLQASSGYANRYAGDADRGAAMPSRQYGYGGAYRSRSSDRATNAKQSQVRYRSHPSE